MHSPLIRTHACYSVHTQTHTQAACKDCNEAAQDVRKQLLCVWQSDTGFAASLAFWYYIVCFWARQKGLLQVWRLWMFQLSEFPDKLVCGTQWTDPFIHTQFNFTLSYITLSPRGRISYPILHLGRASYAPQTTQLVFSSFSLSVCLCTVCLLGL